MPTPVILLGLDGRPKPPEEIVRRLRAIDPRMGLKFVPGVLMNWAVTMEFGPDDRRRKDIQSGKVNPEDAYDIIGWLPAECSLDEAPAYISRMIAMYPREDVRKALDRMEAWNATEGGKEEMEEVLNELADDNFGLEVPKVTGKRKRVKVNPT